MNFPLQAEKPQTLLVCAASDLTYCLEELNAAFQKAHPEITVKATLGASGNLLAQIQNGAPYDVFLSADIQYPKALIDAKAAEADSLTPYATGHLVVWTTTPGIDVKGGAGSLTADAIQKIAIANPEHAPYGRAAKAALEHLGLWEKLREKIVLGENIAQTAQFVETGNAQAGIVALSLVLSPKLANRGSYAAIPLDSYPALEQGAVITKKGGANPAAKTYLEFLKSPEARAIFDRYGFLLPEGGRAASQSKIETRESEIR